MELSGECSFCVNCRLEQCRDDVPFPRSKSCTSEICWRNQRLTPQTTNQNETTQFSTTQSQGDTSQISSTPTLSNEASITTPTASTRSPSLSTIPNSFTLQPSVPACHSRCCDLTFYQTFLLILVFVMLSPSVLSSPLFSPAIGTTESSQESDSVWSLNDLALVEASEFTSMEENSTYLKPKWINPCGINVQEQLKLIQDFESQYDVTPLSDGELLENIILASRNALRHSRFFLEDYVKNTFHSQNWWSHHLTWKNMKYDWLPNVDEIPKELTEKPHVSHLEDLKLEKTLQNIYNYLQRLAVGLEQVVLDQIVYDGRYLEEFNEAEFKLKSVLCEIQLAMLEKGVVPYDDVTREIMPTEVRDIENESYRNLRDWYIYRDYMNGLEYVVHAFTHLWKKQPQQKRSLALLMREPRSRKSRSFRRRK